MATQSFYPNIGTLITLDDFPEELQFLEIGLQNALNKIYYKELQYVKSSDGSQGYYNIVLVTGEPLKLNLMDTGFSIIINPGSAGETLIPITLNYNWPVLAFIKNFNLQSFSYLPDQLQEVMDTTMSLSDTDLIQSGVQIFEGDDSSTSYNNFVDKVNVKYSLSGSSAIPYPTMGTSLDMAEDIRLSISQNSLITDDIKAVIDGIYIYSSNNTDYQNNLNQFTEGVTSQSIMDYVKEIIIPKIDASLDIAVGLAFPRSLLLPINPATNEPLPEPEQSILVFDVGTLLFSTQGGINFEQEMSVSLNHPSEIGTTGLGIALTRAKLDLSQNTNIIEADLDGRPQNFTGVYAEYVAVTLPPRWFNNVDNTTLRIAGYNMLIGTGGVSGTIALEAVNGTPATGDDYLNVNIGSWQLGFNYFDITFKQNDIVSSNIRAKLVIPKFKKPNGDIAEILVDGHLEANGDFKLTASTTPPYPTIEFGDVFKLHMKSVELGREDNDFFIGAAADIEFKGLLAGLLEGQGITIGAALRIYSNGRIDFKVDGGSLVLAKPVKLKLGPVELSVSAIHFGAHEREKDGQIRKYNYFGFDAGVNIGIAGIDARGDGIKFYYSIDDGPGKPHDSYLHIQTIHVDLIIPANSNDPSVMIKGWLSIPEPGGFPEFKGGVNLKIKNPRIAGYVDMRLAPKYPAFLIEAGIELPNPIPLGPVSIYGFKGLLGYRYVAEKEAIGMTSDNTWYEYYTAPTKGVGVEKFSRPDQTEHYSFPFSLGVGAIIGDTMAAGNIISANAMLLLSLPSMVMVEARMKLLSKRVSFADDPPFFAFFIFGDNSLEFGFGADYKFPENSGDIIKIYAEIQAGFFFNNPSAWYINFGTQQAPISAKLLKDIFTLKAFLMISGKGIQAGARGEFRFERRFGPVYILVLAYLELGGRISFERPQVGGYFEAGLAIDINVKIFRIYASVTILLAVESPRPFLIYGKFTVKFKIKVIFFKINFKAEIELKWEFNKDVDRTPIDPFTEVSGQMGALAMMQIAAAAGEGDGLVKGISMLTGEPFGLANLKQPNGSINLDLNKIRQSVVPLDTYIDLKTTKGLLPGNITGANIGGVSNPPGLYTDLVPPEKIMKGLELRQVKHQYSIQSIEIMAYSQTMGWQPYNPYRALYPNDPDPMLDQMSVGQWQKKDNQYNAIRLLATTPFSYTELGEPGWFIPEQYGITPTTLFCVGERIKRSVSNFLDKALNTQYYAFSNNFFYSKGAAYQVDGDTNFVLNPNNTLSLTGDYAMVTDESNIFAFDQSLQFPNHTPLIIMLPAPSSEIELKLSTYDSGVTIEYYKPIINDSVSYVQYELVESIYKTRLELQDPIDTEFAPIEGVTKIIIRPDETNMAQIAPIMAQMATLMDKGFQTAVSEGGELKEIKPSDPKRYAELEKQLAKAREKGCQGIDVIKDKRACEIYPQLIQYQNNNFDQPFIYYPEGKQPDEKELVIEHARFIDRNREVYFTTDAIFRETRFEDKSYEINLDQYSKSTEILVSYLERIPEFDFDNSREVIRLFKPVKTKFDQLTDIVSVKRDCYDRVLCDFSIYLSFQEYGRFIDKPPVSESPLLDAYYIFIEQNPQYQYLNNILQHQINVIQTIVDNGPFAYLENREAFNQACEQMIAMIADLGNCNTRTKCFTLFHEVSWLTVENYQYNQNIPGQAAISEDAQETIAGIQRFVQPIWRPDTSYYVRFVLRDEVDNGQGEGLYDYAYGFHTAGPVGFFHLDQYSPYGPIPYEEQDQYPHTSIRSYIDYERSYPNADGNLVNAKPLFYDDETTEISLYFTSRYAFKHLEGWEAVMDGSTVKFPELGGTMKIIIKDPVEDVEIVNPPRLDTTVENIEDSAVNIPQTIEQWVEDDNPIIPPVLQQWINMLNADNCLGIVEIIKPKSYFRKVTPKRLKPQKLYTAQVLNFYWGTNTVDISNLTDAMKADFAREVHKFVFQTSRYRNFEEQVQSCLIEYEEPGGTTQVKQAVYELEKELDAANIQAGLDTVKGIANTLSDAITQQFLDPFDRVVEGLFGFSPMEDAVTTEFNKITDSNTGHVIALLVRNPEPFNHPKIPLEDVQRNGTDAGMIEVLMNDLVTIDTSYHVLYSKDYSQALIMNDAKWIQAAELHFQFLYLTWNGSEYEISDIQKTTNILIN
ncbi:hypothetical protein [Sphingobacterium multivorum]|uniref:hypothetical protein n=1 Tax=Sphingobacterium multivorum TaxID=28454 RepID=UPI003DA34B2F